MINQIPGRALEIEKNLLLPWPKSIESKQSAVWSNGFAPTNQTAPPLLSANQSAIAFETQPETQPHLVPPLCEQRSGGRAIRTRCARRLAISSA